MDKALSFLSGLLIGGGVAALVTLFLAPKSGEETRDMIANKSIELKQQVQSTVAQARKSDDQIVTELESELSTSGNVAGPATTITSTTTFPSGPSGNVVTMDDVVEAKREGEQRQQS